MVFLNNTQEFSKSTVDGHTGELSDQTAARRKMTRSQIRFAMRGFGEKSIHVQIIVFTLTLTMEVLQGKIIVRTKSCLESSKCHTRPMNTSRYQLRPTQIGTHEKCTLGPELMVQIKQ
jgi:hypothetical protein